MKKIINNFVRKAIKAEFKDSDTILFANNLSDPYRIHSYWTSSQNGKVADIGIFLLWSILYFAMIIGLPIVLFHYIVTPGIDWKYAALLSLMIIAGWLYSLYFFGLYTGFLRYVAREDHKLKWY